jgi:hypothetical protein
MADDARLSAAKIAALRQGYDALRRRQAAVFQGYWSAIGHGIYISPKAKLFDKLSLIARRIAKGDNSKAAATKLENEATRLLLAEGGDAGLLKRRLRAGVATPAEQSFAADLRDGIRPDRQDRPTVKVDQFGRPTRRGKPVKLSDKIGRELLKQFLAEIESTLPPSQRTDALKAWDKKLQKKERRALTKADIREVAERYGVLRKIFYEILKTFPKTAARFERLPPGD